MSSLKYLTALEKTISRLEDEYFLEIDELDETEEEPEELKKMASRIEDLKEEVVRVKEHIKQVKFERNLAVLDRMTADFHQFLKVFGRVYNIPSRQEVENGPADYDQ